jgi:hypothetical protein
LFLSGTATDEPGSARQSVALEPSSKSILNFALASWTEFYFPPGSIVAGPAVLIFMRDSSSERTKRAPFRRFLAPLAAFIPMAKTKDWPRVRKGLNGSGQTTWIVDLRPHGKRLYFPSKDAALGEAEIQRTRLQNEGLEGFEFTLDQRTDALAALTLLAGSSLSLTQAAKIAVEFHGIQTSGISLNDAVAALLKAKSKRSERYRKDLRLKLARPRLRPARSRAAWAAWEQRGLGKAASLNRVLEN